MSQIEFTSQCGGDIGVTLQDEVITIAFIYKGGDHLLSHVHVYDIRAGGEHVRYADLASALQAMLCMADDYRTMDIEKEIEAQAKKAFGHASYFASNKED